MIEESHKIRWNDSFDNTEAILQALWLVVTDKDSQ